MDTEGVRTRVDSSGGSTEANSSAEKPKSLWLKAAQRPAHLSRSTTTMVRAKPAPLARSTTTMVRASVEAITTGVEDEGYPEGLNTDSPAAMLRYLIKESQRNRRLSALRPASADGQRAPLQTEVMSEAEEERRPHELAT